MSDAEWTQCPECGWTGERSELDAVEGVHRCPICDEDIEIIE